MADTNEPETAPLGGRHRALTKQPRICAEEIHFWYNKHKTPPQKGAAVCVTIVSRATLELIRFGGDLLSHVLRRSTIGATVLNCRVRDGIGCFTRAVATKPNKFQSCCLCFHKNSSYTRLKSFRLQHSRFLTSTGSNQAYRAISTSQLNALLHLHLWPIDVVVYHGPQGRPGFEGGFPLRCFQRLSCPNIATQHCRWHDNWSTSGSFTPVLSY
jgi:hypothetical protein